MYCYHRDSGYSLCTNNLKQATVLYRNRTWLYVCVIFVRFCIKWSIRESDTDKRLTSACRVSSRVMCWLVDRLFSLKSSRNEWTWVDSCLSTSAAWKETDRQRERIVKFNFVSKSVSVIIDEDPLQACYLSDMLSPQESSVTLLNIYKNYTDSISLIE